MNKLICFLIGHDDPVMMVLGLKTQAELYNDWQWNARCCRRCGKVLGPRKPIKKDEAINTK